MKHKLLLSGIIVIALALVMSGCICSIDNNVQKEAEGPNPLFTALRTNDTSFMIMLLNADGAQNITGLHVDSPAISSPDIIAANASVPSGKEIYISDPNLAGKVNLTISASVDGKNRIVLNGTL